MSDRRRRFRVGRGHRAVTLAALTALLFAGCGTTPHPDPPGPPAAPAPPLIACINLPSRCGYPDSTNTGANGEVPRRRVPEDVTEGSGWTWDPRGTLHVIADNTVLENLTVTGSVEVSGRNVTVRNNVILATGDIWGVGLRRTHGATITDNEIGAVNATPRLLVGIKDIYGDATGTTVSRNDIAGAATGVQLYSGVIRGNYIHDLAMVPDDHVNGIMSNGSIEPLVIDHNTVLNRFEQTDAVGLFQDFGVESNRLVTGNLLAGGGYTVYGGDNRRFGPSSQIRIVNNRFSRIYFPRGGLFGPLAAFDAGGAGNLWEGNIWDEDASPVE